MKVAVSASGDSLDAMVNPRFGRCEYFVIVDTDSMNYTAFANENAGLSSGAGIQSASFAASQGVQAVLTGNCGPKAAQTFSAANIDVYTGYSGTVRQAVEKFTRAGEALRPAQSAAGSALDSGQAASRQKGTGMGRGLGMGGGMGMGGGGRCRGGGGRGMGGGMRRMSGDIAPASTPPANTANPEGLAELKEQAAQLKQQLEQIQQKISNLE